MKPTYYKVMWHNCSRCKTHYTSEEPHLRAYLCNECWDAMPKYRVKVPIAKRPTKKKGQSDYSLREILLYTIGNLACLTVIGYYLLFN